MTILHEHWEVHATEMMYGHERRLMWSLTDEADVYEWSSFGDRTEQFDTREAAKARAASETNTGWKRAPYVVHVVRRKRGDARREALEEAAAVVRDNHLDLERADSRWNECIRQMAEVFDRLATTLLKEAAGRYTTEAACSSDYARRVYAEASSASLIAAAVRIRAMRSGR